MVRYFFIYFYFLSLCDVAVDRLRQCWEVRDIMRVAIAVATVRPVRMESHIVVSRIEKLAKKKGYTMAQSLG